MTKIHRNKLSWDLLELRTHRMAVLKPNRVKTIRAFDSETLAGYAHLIADDTGAFRDIHGIYDALSFLTQKPYRSSVNFWYNIQFDFDAIMKYLPVSKLKELVETLHVDIEKYHVRYIPKKLFSIRLNKDSYTFYDLAQFYEMKLETAAEKYCSGRKNPDSLDVKLIGSSPEYWAENYELIRKYCIQDCALTVELGNHLQDDLIQTTGTAPKSYISQAGLSKDYFRRHCDIPDIREVPEYAQRCAFESYHGGRFEVTERGHIGETSSIDIHSAYPAQIAQLIDITAGRWKRTDRLSKDAYYGFYLAEVDLPYMHLPPLAMDFFQTVVYPCGKWSGYFSRDELIRVGKIGGYKVITGAEFFPYVIRYPFRAAIETLYKKKNGTPKKNYQYNLYKKLMNSLYGCFYEKTLHEDGKLHVGVLWNPVYASIVTEKTRLQLWDEACKYGKDCVSMATDGLLIRGDHDLPDEDVLGGWGYEGKGDCTILRSGIYALGDKMKQRCVIKKKKFHTPFGDYVNLFDYIHAHPDWKKYPVLNHRPVHMREAIVHCKTRTKDDINIFEDHKMAFDLNSDRKRIFSLNNITGKELLEARITSRPWMFPLRAHAEVEKGIVEGGEC